MRWMLVMAALIGVSLCGLGPAAACEFSFGQYVVMTLEDPPRPAIVLDVTDVTCLVEMRELVAPGAPFDPYISSMLEDFLAVYDGPLANRNDFGCPYGPGQNVDFQTPEGAWRPASIAQSNKACDYELTYFEAGAGTQVTLTGNRHDLLRPSTLPAPTPAEIDAAKLCPPGGTIEDYADQSEDSLFKRAIIDDINRRVGNPVSMYFDTIRTAAALTVRDGSTFLANNPDAAIGADIFPFRLEARVCQQNGDRPEMTSHVYDYNCFTDKFGDFVCRQEAER